MNSCSVQRVPFNVRVLITIHCHAFQLFVMLACIYCPPPYSPVDPAATADYTAAGYDYVDDDRTPTVELPGKQPFPSPTYRLSIYIYLLH